MPKTRTTLDESMSTRSAGIHGFIIGVVAGAIVIGIFAIILDVFGVAHGGVVLSMMGGGALGGLAGLMYGVLSARRKLSPR